MKLYFKAFMLIGTLLLTNSAYAHNGEDHGGGLSFVPPVTTPLLPKPHPITPIVTAPSTTPKPVNTSGNPNQQFVTSVPSTKPTVLPPLLTFTPLAPTPVHNHGTTTTSMNEPLHPIHTMTGSSGGTNVSEPLGMVSVMGAMLGFMVLRRKKTYMM